MASDSTRIGFGPFSFDKTEGVLSRGAATIALQHQPAKVLAYLLEHRDRTVSRAELVHHVWPAGHHVDFDRGLNYCIRQVRRALGDSAQAPRYLATVAQTGYRWIAPTTAAATPAFARPLIRMAPDISRPMPLWSAIVMTAASALIATSLSIRVNEVSAPRSGPSASVQRTIDSSGWRLAFDALHRLSHVVVEPERRAELPMALESLWVAAVRLAGTGD